MEKGKKTAEELLAEDVTNDFLRRREERRRIERGWQLAMNFESGNQYCDINSSGELFSEEKTYYWQSRQAFNHIAPCVEMRCSKLGRIRPALIVRPASDEESDRHSAELSSAILSAVADGIGLDAIISEATVWSETCGTVFYKIIWDFSAGEVIADGGSGGKLRQGDINVSAVSPFEIYPHSLSEEKLSAQPSIIHAKAMPVQDISAAYGVELAGGEIDDLIYSSGDMQGAAGLKRGYELVIERYERPTKDRPLGRLTAVAGGKLLYDGDLPYVNRDGGERGYPFVKQTALPKAGSFFGASPVERLIPLQRAYNAVKNRKHEFLNRISMGTVAVEDGSVDTDELAEDGLTPGKVIVYRQGGKPPEMLTLGSVPSEFGQEEERLLNEFTKLSGAGDLTDNADGFAGITSASGIQLVLEQSDIKMEYAYRQIKYAMKDIGRHILRLYRQFATDVRLLKHAGKNNVLNLFYFKGCDISSDDVYLDADTEANLSPAQRRAVIYEILDRGLYSDGDGKLGRTAKNKVLELLGYGAFEGERDLCGLNRARAGEENLKLQAQYVGVKDYDDHTVHISEHTAFLLTEKCGGDVEMRICAHIDMHRQKFEQLKKGDIKNGA